MSINSYFYLAFKTSSFTLYFMPIIKYITANHTETEVSVAVGLSVMHGATVNMIDGILAECGGGLTCATCHCYVDEQWINKTGIATDKELEKLTLVNNPKMNSRLSCQIIITDDLDGLVVQLPESQVWSK